MRKVVAYIRVSTEEQKLGPQAQRDAIDAWCSSKGYELIAVHEDIGVSGAAPIDKRPALLQTIGDIKANEATILVVAKRDRLARDVMITAMIERMVEREGAMVLSADGVGNGQGPEDQFMRNLMAAFAQYERALIAARTRAALTVKKNRGEVYGRIPFGFKREGKMLVEDPEQHASELRAYALYRSIGTYSGVAEALNREGAKTPRGGRWHATSVRNLIKRLQAA
jgi:DNA invertase Pin-like site-specific DNA recombinase